MYVLFSIYSNFSLRDATLFPSVGKNKLFFIYDRWAVSSQVVM